MLQTFAAAARAPLAGLLEQLSVAHRRVVVVFDRLNSFVATEAARLRNGEAFGLQCVAGSYNIGRLDPEHRLLRDHATTTCGSSPSRRARPRSTWISYPGRRRTGRARPSPAWS
jgi:hypothetical protein